MAICIEDNPINRLDRALESLGGILHEVLLNNIPDVIELLDPDGRYLFCNAAWFETLGYTPEQQRELSVFELTHSSCRERSEAAFAGVLSGVTQPLVALTLVRSDGTAVEVEGKVIAIRGKDGQITCILRTLRDVTAQIEAERELVNAYARAEYIEGIQQTAVSLQHEINNPLCALMGRVELIKWRFQREYAAEDSSAQFAISQLTEISELAERVSRVVHALRNMATPQTAQHPVSSHEHVEMIHLPLANTVPHGKR